LCTYLIAIRHLLYAVGSFAFTISKTKIDMAKQATWQEGRKGKAHTERLA